MQKDGTFSVIISLGIILLVQLHNFISVKLLSLAFFKDSTIEMGINYALVHKVEKQPMSKEKLPRIFRKFGKLLLLLLLSFADWKQNM